MALAPDGEGYGRDFEGRAETSGDARTGGGHLALAAGGRRRDTTGGGLVTGPAMVAVGGGKFKGDWLALAGGDGGNELSVAVGRFSGGGNGGERCGRPP